MRVNWEYVERGDDQTKACLSYYGVQYAPDNGILGPYREKGPFGPIDTIPRYPGQLEDPDNNVGDFLLVMAPEIGHPVEINVEPGTRCDAGGGRFYICITGCAETSSLY